MRCEGIEWDGVSGKGNPQAIVYLPRECCQNCVQFWAKILYFTDVSKSARVALSHRNPQSLRAAKTVCSALPFSVSW